jgi:hypothetical protein
MADPSGMEDEPSDQIDAAAYAAGGTHQTWQPLNMEREQHVPAVRAFVVDPVPAGRQTF